MRSTCTSMFTQEKCKVFNVLVVMFFVTCFVLIFFLQAVSESGKERLPCGEKSWMRENGNTYRMITEKKNHKRDDEEQVNQSPGL